MPPTASSLRRRPLLPRLGFYGLAAVLILLFLSGCSDQPLQAWHTEALTAEFTAAKAAKVGSCPIHFIGYSTGAPLALDFALDVLEGKAAPVPGRPG